MPVENTLITLRKPRILVSPLDWGLGHATRCVPIIQELLKLDCDVWLAADGATRRLLHNQFPQLAVMELPGYNIRYSKSLSGLSLRMLAQLPKIYNSISYENKWLRIKQPVYEFDAIISDNRLGFYHRKADSVFITHQLSIKTGMGKFFDWLAGRINYKYIRKFKYCWIADEANETNLAGELSHPEKMPGCKTEYIGTLSRLKPATGNEIKNHLLIVLSGPEPQRTILEKIIVNEIAMHAGTATIVRGLPNNDIQLPSTPSFKFYNHLSAEGLNAEMIKAEYIISRSGYSTIMEIARLNKKSILVPTPGQGEQEYLAKELSGKKRSVCIAQKKFSLIQAIEKAKAFAYQPFPAYNDEAMKKSVGDFVKQLERKINSPDYAEFLG